MFRFFDTGLLRPQGELPADKNLYIYYTAEWDMPDPNEATNLYFWASGLAEIALNGVCIHQGPCRDSLPLLYYDVVQLRNLKSGKNRIAIKLNVEEIEVLKDANGNMCEYMGILLEIHTSNKCFTAKELNIRTGYFTSYSTDVPKNSGAGYSEVVVSGLEDNWFTENSGICTKPAVTGFIVPETALNERCIPLFEEKEISPKSVLIEPEGSILFDFEEMVFGRVNISGKANGDVVIGYIEDLEHGWSNAEGNQEMYQDRLLKANGEFNFKSFRKRAFRYVRLYGAEERKLKLCVLEYGYPTEQLGDFVSSDDFLNRLMKISCATLRVNVDDIYNDCPHRDQSQWMDAYLSSKIMLALYGDTALARKCLYQHAIGSFHNGTICSPSINGTVMFADYALIFFDYVMWYYRVTRDKSALADLQNNLREVLEYFSRYIDETGLLRSAKELGLVYLDNTFELSRSEHSAALNALYYMALMRFAEICRILEQLGEAELFEKRAKEFQNRFFPSFKHPTVEGCLRDSDTMYTDGYYMVNFSCEFGSWHSIGASMEFCIDSDIDRELELYVAEYAGFRVFCNGNICADKPHEAGWDRQPCYDPILISIPLKQGKNIIRWEVRANQLNFELFFRTRDNSELNFYSPESFTPMHAVVAEYDYDSGCSVSKAESREIRVRNWVPPLLSQSTHMYACISGIYSDVSIAKEALKRIMVPEYIRTYLSVRVPYFCNEAGALREKEDWVMPVNTPWTGSFLLLALSQYGCADLGLSMLRHFWSGMIERGAVNTWEEWGDRSSLCHAWGATPAYFMLNQILGVEHCLDKDGNILIRPNLFDLQWAKGYVAVGRDKLRIYVSLRKTENTTEVTIRVPDGVKAQIDLSLLKNPIVCMNWGELYD